MTTSFWQKRRNRSLTWYIRNFYQAEAVGLINEKKVDVDFSPGHEGSPLYLAASVGADLVAQALLAAGADPNLVEANVRPPLQRALECKSISVAATLVGAGADLSRRNGDGATPLLLAAEQGASELVLQMVAKGADVNAKNTEGETALHFAAAGGFGAIVQCLMEHGADTKALNGNMNSPADVAEKSFPRLALLIRGIAPAEPAPPAAAPASEKPAAAGHALAGWKLIAPEEVAFVAERPAIGYRLTEIFNFGSGIYTRLARSLETGAESQAVRFFEEFPDHALLDRAHAALVGLGGTPPEAPAAKTLDKPSLPAPGGPK